MSSDHPAEPRTAEPGTLARVFVPFACGYFLSFLLRNVNAVVFPDLVRTFGLSPDALGLLSSAYFFGFALFQIPLGILLDRYGPRRVQSALLFLAALGTLGFAAAQSLPDLVVARTAMGVGFAGGLMASMTAFVLWFARERMATLGGWMLAVGSLGAVTATVPVEAALRILPWRVLFLALGCLVLLASVIVLRTVPERDWKPAPSSAAAAGRELREIYANRAFWRIALPAAVTQGGALALLSLWAGPWLRDIAHLDRPAIAWHLSAAALSFGAGSILFGMASDRLARRGIHPETTFLAGCMSTAVALVPIAFCLSSFAIVAWCAYIGCAAAGALAFPLLTSRFPKHMAGRVLTGINVLIMACAFGCQAGVGTIIGTWPVVDGAYARIGYQTALFAILALQFCASGWSWLSARRARASGH